MILSIIFWIISIASAILIIFVQIYLYIGTYFLFQLY